MAGGGWAFLSGFANSLGNSLERREQDKRDQEREERQARLLELQRQAQQKREEFLIDYRVAAENRKKEADRERTEGDVKGKVTNPETGEVMGYTRDGKQVPLVNTTPDYQSALATKMTNANANTEARTNLANARIGETNARTGLIGKQGANIDSQIKDRENKTPADKTPAAIQKAYLSLMGKEQAKEDRAAAEAKKNGQSYTPRDSLQMQQGVLDQLQYAYGADTVSSALGKQQRQSAQPTAGKPTPEQIIAEANAAMKARPDLQPQIEAKMKALFQQYGYQQ